MENIALAFSGGGFRAATFSLGSISYLNHVQYKGKPLLTYVRFISSTSGGSITNLAYSSFVFQGKPFSDCYEFLLKSLDGEKLISKAMAILHKSEVWKERPGKSRNLINAFAIAYDELFDKDTLGLFNQRDHQPHLEEICINATEFTNGLAFRFHSQHPDKRFPKGRIGNNYIYIRRDPNSLNTAQKIKLADILASSSCFPLGFEPMIFPDDYTYAQLSAEELTRAVQFKANQFTRNNHEKDILEDKTFKETFHFGVMDGGVTDNQAIDSFQLANNRRLKKDMPPFSLFISCDVTSFYMNGYSLPLEKRKWYNQVTLQQVINIIKALAFIFPLLLLSKLFIDWYSWMYILAAISCIALLVYSYGLWKYKKQNQNAKVKKNTWNIILLKYADNLLRIRLSAIAQMIKTRTKSVSLLSSEIYLKQIRRMYYDSLFTNPKYRDISIANTIHDLSMVNFTTDAIPDHITAPSKEIVEVAEKARNMGTTLWFDEVQQSAQTKEAIITTGQFTMCYNLIRYLNKIQKSNAGNLNPELEALRAALLEDWLQFRNNPYFLYHKLST